MADVSISYKDATIAQMSASGTKTLLTADNYCENNIVVEYTRPTASDLVSGTLSITENGTGIDVTNYSAVDVAVPVPIDVPVFTLITNANGEVISLTCNKTFNECLQLITGFTSKMAAVVKGYFQTLSQAQHTADYGLSGQDDYDTQHYIIYYGYIDYGIRYNADGTIVRVSGPEVETQDKIVNITPSTTAQSQTVVGDTGYFLNEVTINTAAMPAGTAGTPTATKGTVSNHSVSVTPSVTNTTGYITGQTKTGTAVTVSANELVSGSQTITENGTVDVTNLASVVVNVSGGGGGGDPASPKQIYFIDYDGTIVESYTKSEWQNVTALPSNPSHSGLTAQGWNWTKAQIDEQLTAMPDNDVWVGQMYITDDGKTRVYIRLEEGKLHPYFGICPNGTVVVDWGDNSATVTLTGTSLTTVQTADHEYTSAGDYVITLTVSSGSFAFCGESSTSYILRKNDTTTTNIHRVYTNTIQKIELGIGVNIGNYAFQNCHSLANITIPSEITSIGYHIFANCYSLVSVTIPNGITSIDDYTFYSCYSLTNVTIPSKVTSIGSYAFCYCSSLASIMIPSGVTSIDGYSFQNCYSLENIPIPSGVKRIGGYMFNSCYSLASITIPSSVTRIDNYAFQYCYSLASITIPSGVTRIDGCVFRYCYGMAEYHFLRTTPPTLANTNAFNSIPSDCIIYVPSESLEAYQTATNWSTYASHMRGE